MPDRRFVDLDRLVDERWAPEVGAAGPFVTVDSHTAGEATRLVVSGPTGLEDGDVAEKRAHLERTQDHVRRALMAEPRGHRDSFGAVLTPPATEGAAFGLVYMDARRYPYLCGHATIGAVTTLLEAGAVAGPRDGTVDLTVDTPSGPVAATATAEAGRVTEVRLQPEPALLYARDRRVEVPGFGNVPVDVVLAGGFFCMVDARAAGLSLEAEAAPALADVGMRIVEAANQQLEVRHPTRPYIDTVDVVSFYGPGAAGADGRNAVVYGQAHVDRSPCGTGTCARLALEHGLGRLDVDRPFINEGPLGTRFFGRVVAVEDVGGHPAIRPEIGGRAFITGTHRFWIDGADPLAGGYLLG